MSNIKTQSAPELVAPAGNMEKMKTAFAFGADAVYIGIPDFSLRVRINDFDLKSLGVAIKYAHGLKKKIYVTINILAHNQHLKKLPAYLKFLKKSGPDGLIVADPGIFAIIKKHWPTAKVHLSTQANCTNWSAAQFWHQQGFKRVVLGREVSLVEVKEIKKNVSKLELETFIHGAMCMAYSGRCFLSKYFTTKEGKEARSANLGDCIQSCRWKYETIKNYKLNPPAGGTNDELGERKIGDQELGIRNSEFGSEGGLLIKPEGRDEVLELVEEAHGSYILNSQDLCLIKRVPELMKAGISAFKIEGRAKSVYYLACVVWAYRRAIDLSMSKKKNLAAELDKLHQELEEKLVHRGYTEGFMFGAGYMAQNLENSHNHCDWEFCGQVLSCQANKKTNKYEVLIKVHNTLKFGDELEIIAPGYDIIKMKLGQMMDAATGVELIEAHGGQNKAIKLLTDFILPEMSVIRRKS